MSLRTPTLLGAVALVMAAPALAQETGDESRLVFNVSLGWASGGDLWAVPNQPVLDISATDTFNVQRNMSETWAAGMSGTYYKGSHIGIGVDLLLVNLQYNDTCQLAFASGSVANADTCASINGSGLSALSSQLTGTVIYRFASRSPVSPFIRANAGIMVANLNTTRLSGFYVNEDDLTVEVPIYTNSDQTRISPVGAIGAGVTFAIARAYHLRIEARGSSYTLNTVTGPNSSIGGDARTEAKRKTQLTLMVGVDLLLERSRGRRY